MKKFLLVILILSISAVQAYAHPPSKIDISFDNATKILVATIYHPVQNVRNHYITKVDVGLNGEQIIEHHMSRQDNDTTQVVSYRIPDADVGDVISVEGHCSMYGTRTEKIKVQ